MLRHSLVPAAMTGALLGLALSTTLVLAAGLSPADKAALPEPAYVKSAALLTPTERCKAYEHRFDAAVASHQQAAKLDEARVLRIEGAKLCTAGSHGPGEQKLIEALKYLGVDSKL